MGQRSRGIELPAAPPERLAAAVRTVLTEQAERGPTLVIGRLPTVEALRAGAAESVKNEPIDIDVARYFQSLLELGYLVASADGLAQSEREALALLLEGASSAVVDRDTLLLHFRDLDATTETLGRRERLARVAAGFTDPESRTEALGFAALVAMADGHLAEPELEVLHALGREFSMAPDKVDAAVAALARRIEERLR